MDKEMQNNAFFHVEIMRDVYLISDTASSPTGILKSFAAGNPTGNSYLVVGEDRALLFDLAVNLPNIQEYVENLAGKPVQLVLSHGHYDHAYYLNEFEEVWMHPADETFIRDGMLSFPPVIPCPKIHPLKDGDAIDLGNRRFEVFNIPGHTPGSILLLDENAGILLSGDTCARRLLYGTAGLVPVEEFCENLSVLNRRKFDVIYSAHDRCAIPRSYIDYMIKMIKEDLPHTDKFWEYPGFDKMAHLVVGDVYSLNYFDVAIPKKLLER